MRIIAACAIAGALLPSTLTAQPAPAKRAPTSDELRTAAATSPEPVAPAASTVSSTYRISSGDLLDIYVWGDERLQRAMTVLPDGTFAFPLAGTVKAVGRTPNDIEAELSRLLAPQYKGVAPQVTVSVKQTTGMQVSVIGKVRSPGSFSPNHYLTLLDVLALSGGPTDFADVNNIVILRHDGNRTTVVRAKVAGMLKGRPSDTDLTGAGNPQLLSGDTVVVP